MNPKLLILKGKNGKDRSARKSANGRRIRFAVVDKDLCKAYPANFVCILPQHMSAETADTSLFTKIFKETRIELAKRLLADALHGEPDSQVKKEIRDRLRHLEPRPNPQANRSGFPMSGTPGSGA